MKPWQIWIVSPSLMIMFFKLIEMWRLKNTYQAFLAQASTNKDIAKPIYLEIMTVAWVEIGLMLVMLNIVILIPAIIKKRIS